MIISHRPLFYSLLPAAVCAVLLGCYDEQVLSPSPEDTTRQTAMDGGDEQPAIPSYTDITALPLDAASGVDILFVIDNGPTLGDAQLRFSDAVATLISQLTSPPEYVWLWGFPQVTDLRVAVVTSDLGLQAGGTVGVNTPTVETCLNPVGDNGNFQGLPESVSKVHIDSVNYWCDGAGLVVDTACRVRQGTSGCIIAQPFEAMMRALETQPDFVQPDHTLVVVMLSDKDDCSIRDPQLFNGPHWQMPNAWDVACYMDDKSYDSLYPISRYIEELTTLKGGNANRLVLGAIVGVPQHNALCEGDGRHLEASNCLANMEPRVYTPNDTEVEPYMLFSACVSATQFEDTDLQFEDTETDAAIQRAVPGTRFVKLAQAMGTNAQVFSICNKDYKSAVTAIGKAAAATTAPLCLPKQLPWSLLKDSCIACGRVAETCDLFLSQSIEDESECPTFLFDSLKPGEKSALEVRIHEGIDETGAEVRYCPVPKLPTPIGCNAADTSVVWEGVTGWAYCLEDNGCAFRVRLSESVQSYAADHGNRVFVQCDDK